MLGNIGLTTMIFIVILALLLFGPNKLPELGRAIGKTLREFKKGASGIMDEEDDAKDAGRKEVADNARKSEDGGSSDNRRLPD